MTLGGITVFLPPFAMRLKRSGFSLVLSLTVMASMVMMVIVLASFLQVESRLAQSHSGYLRARFNALASAKIAIGQLQVLAGPDQRVTMRSDMYSPEVNPPAPINAPALPRVGSGILSAYNPNSPATLLVSHQKRFLTGVWATGGVQSNKIRDWDVTDPHNTRLFLGWLCSPMYPPTTDLEAPDTSASYKLPNFLPNRSYYNPTTGQAIMTESQALIDDLANPILIASSTSLLVPLVSSGTISWPASATTRLQQQYYGAVDMLPMPLPGPTSAGNLRPLGRNGRYAFWIGDEGLKAKINLPDAFAKSSTGVTLANSLNWEKELGGSAAQRTAIETITTTDRPSLPPTFSANFITWRDTDIAVANSLTGKADSLLLPKMFTPASLVLWATKQGGIAAGQTMVDGMRTLWHDITPWSFSTLTDTYNGGLKYDLSTAFELPYTLYRGLEIYTDQKDLAKTPNDSRRQSLFHNAPGYADLDFNRPNLVDKIASPIDLLAAYPRASEWAPRYTASLLGSPYTQLKAQNGGETPERMGFVYEVPLGSRFFAPTTSFVSGTTFSRLDTTTTQPLATSPATPVRVFSLPWSELNATDPENLNGRIVRGPTWDLYRNYYRMYKREVEASNNTRGLMGQQTVSNNSNDLTVIARGLEPLTFASGNRVPPLSKAGDDRNYLKKFTEWPLKGQNDAAFQPEERFYATDSAVYKDFYYRNNFSDTTFGPDFQADRRIFPPFNIYTPGTPTTAPAALGNLNIQWNWSGINNITPGVFGTYETSALARPTATTAPKPDSFYDLPTGSPGFQAAPAANTATTNTTTRTWPTSMNIAPSVIRFGMVYSTVWNADMLGITIDPYITLHNPYDCAIEFEGIAMVTNDQSMTYYFEFEVGGSSQYDFSAPNRFVVGDVCLSQSYTDGRELSFRAVAGQNGSSARAPKVLRLEPGEVRIVAPNPGRSQSASETNRRNNLSGNSPVAVPGDLMYEQNSRLFFPMTSYVGMKRVMQTKPGKPKELCEDFTDDEIINESNAIAPGLAAPWPLNQGALNNKWWMEHARTNARYIKTYIPGWSGTIPSLNAELFRLGKKPYLKFRNYGWTNYSGYLMQDPYRLDSLGQNIDMARPTNAMTGMAGNLHFNFYLLNQKSAKQLLPLNWERRWSGGRDTANVGASFRLGEDTPGGWWTVDQPLLLNLQTLSAGWPMFGNSNRGYETIPLSPYGPSDPYDFTVRSTGNWGPRRSGSQVGDPELNAGGKKALVYYDDLAQSVYESQFGKLVINGPIASQSSFTWANPSANIFKYPVLFYDMLLRGAKESSALKPWYPGTTNDWVSGATGITTGSSGDRLVTPTELRNAPMNPFFTSSRAQQAYLFGYDGKAHGPVGWITRQIPLNGGQVCPIELQGDNAFWGTSVNSTSIIPSSGGGVTSVILYPIPRRPMLSLSQLGSVAFAQTNTDPDFTVGSSFAHPGIVDLTKIVDWPGPKVLSGNEINANAGAISTLGTNPGQAPYWIPEHGYAGKSMGEGVIRNRSNVRTDHAFAANLTLWDSYFFSGLNLGAPSYSSQSGNWPDGPNLPTDPNVSKDQSDYLKSQGVADPTSFASVKKALDAGYLPLANKRVAYVPDYKPASDTFPKINEFPHPAYMASTSLYNGGFNVNSTSKPAWKAVLAGLKGQSIPNANGFSQNSALTKFARAFDASGANGTTKPWSSYRELTDKEIDALAAAIVSEVRRRGPFMSLADFVNRRLINDDAFGLKGALQAAIDYTDGYTGSSYPINKTAINNAGGTFLEPVGANLMNGLGLTPRRVQYYPNDNPWPDTPLVERFPSLRAMTPFLDGVNKPDKSRIVSGLGAPGIVSQMDVLNSIGPNLTARSDTFVVRAYGEALDGKGDTIGKAWVEVVVQRSTEYIGVAGADPSRRKLAYRNNLGGWPTYANYPPPTSAQLTDYDTKPILEKFEKRPSAAAFDDANLNRVFGRRFKTVNLRWLSASEI